MTFIKQSPRNYFEHLVTNLTVMASFWVGGQIFQNVANDSLHFQNGELQVYFDTVFTW
jgi:hypothetical protein